MNKSCVLVIGLVASICLVSCIYSSGSTQPIDVDNTGKDQAPPIDDDRTKFADLFGQAEKTGAVKIIVELKMPGVAGATVNPIAETQDRLIQGLSDFQYSLVRRYSSLPMIVLEVGPEALTYLIHSPLVKSISPDTLVHTMDDPALDQNPGEIEE